MHDDSRKSSVFIDFPREIIRARSFLFFFANFPDDSKKMDWRTNKGKGSTLLSHDPRNRKGQIRLELIVINIWIENTFSKSIRSFFFS